MVSSNKKFIIFYVFKFYNCENYYYNNNLYYKIYKFKNYNINLYKFI